MLFFPWILRVALVSLLLCLSVEGVSPAVLLVGRTRQLLASGSVRNALVAGGEKALEAFSTFPGKDALVNVLDNVKSKVGKEDVQSILAKIRNENAQTVLSEIRNDNTQTVLPKITSAWSQGDNTIGRKTLWKMRKEEISTVASPHPLLPSEAGSKRVEYTQSFVTKHLSPSGDRGIHDGYKNTVFLSPVRLSEPERVGGRAFRVKTLDPVLVQDWRRKGDVWVPSIPKRVHLEMEGRLKGERWVVRHLFPLKDNGFLAKL